MTTPKSHVAVIPFPFSCHPTVFAALMRRLAELASPDVKFSFLNTRSSNKALFHSDNNQHLEPLLSNVKVFDMDDAFPGGGKTTALSSLQDMLRLFFTAAPAKYEEAIGEAEKDVGVPVSCLLTDVSMMFTYEIAMKLKAKWITMWVASPTLFQANYYKDVLVRLSGEGTSRNQANHEILHKALEDIPGLSAIHLSDIPEEMRSLRPGSVLESSRRLLPLADALVMNSYEEVSPDLLTSDLKSRYKKLFHVGCATVKFPPLVLTLNCSISDDPTGCLEFLERQIKPSSVAYISFGTVAVLSPDDIYAIAEALEENKTRYIWSLNDRLKGHLPLGFEGRTSSYGKIVPWAPQSRILSHPSTGVHITHCGYNAVFESVAGEVPMICKPMWTDNMINARMAHEVWGIGVRIEEGCKITKRRMIEYLKMVMEGEQGKKMRANIKNLKEVLMDSVGPNGTASRDLKGLIELISVA